MTRKPHSLATLVALLALAWTTPARADSTLTPAEAAALAADRRAANALYKEGVRLFNARTFADALELFEQAYHRYPDARVLFSIAASQRQLGRSTAAANSYQRFVDDPGADPQLVAESRAVLQTLDVTLGRVAVGFAGARGELQIADHAWLPAGTTLIRVEPGSFILRARIVATGAHAEITGQVAPGEVAEVTVRWSEPVAPPPPPATPPPAAAARPLPTSPPTPTPRPPATTPTSVYVLGAGAIALAGGAIGLAFVSHGARGDAEHACPGLACSDAGALARATALVDRARLARDLAIGVGALSAIAAGAGVAVWWRAHHASPHARELGLAPLVTPRDVGVALIATF